jgi:hypothetical protein
MTKSKSKVKTPGKQKTAEEKSADKAKRAANKSAKSAANTKAQQYLSVFKTSGNCAHDKEKMEKRCKPKEDKPEDPKKKAKKNGVVEIITKASQAVDTLAKDAYKLAGMKPNADNAWMDDHCSGLWAKPTDKNIDKYAQDITNALNEIRGANMQMLADAGGRLYDMAKAGLSPEVFAKKVGGMVVRSGLKEVAAGFFGATGIGAVASAALTAWTAVDMYQTAMEIAPMLGPEGMEILDEITNLKSISGKVDELLATYEKNPMAAAADAQMIIAKLNPCVRARRCMLVPYDETTPATEAAKKGKGCCPGQTGHHLLPSEMFQDCSAYTDQIEAAAPTVCAEGVNNSHGSHGAIHTVMNDLMDVHRKKSGDQITNKEAIDAAAKSHKIAFPGCDLECIKQQLHAYYDDLCEGQIKPRGGKGTPVTPSPTTSPPTPATGGVTSK